MSFNFTNELFCTTLDTTNDDLLHRKRQISVIVDFFGRVKESRVFSLLLSLLSNDVHLPPPSFPPSKRWSTSNTPSPPLILPTQPTLDHALPSPPLNQKLLPLSCVYQVD